ncbi:MFS transporter [Paenibacillus sp. GSMTC-2017]|uniref:MFS transporter n=1 Tax=Paenibacillus sp. GSMTC-2017 TaxID=2794350 RepID=UPI0018D9D395|nr:MFS transporter [Paenibacillus sp. GSMTC-2017]MBH5320471.1 MFS transporter [Paenibacillus sp. GSMTC-2017]
MNRTSGLHHDYRVTAILTWCGLAVVCALYVTIPLVPVIATTFSVPPSHALWISSAFSLAYAIGFLFNGVLSHKFGTKQMMFYGLIALSVVSPLLGLVQNLTLLTALRAIQGLAASTFAPAVLTYIVKAYPVQKRVTAIGFVSMGFLLAGIIGQLFSGIIEVNVGWQYVFFTLSVIYLLSAILLGILIPKSELPQKDVDKGTLRQQLKIIRSISSLRYCYIVTVTLLLSFVGMYVALGNYLIIPPFELSDDHILMIRAAGIVGMLASPFTGLFVKKFGAIHVLHGGLLLAIAGLTLLSISTSLPVLIGMSVIYVTGISVVVPSLISLIGSISGIARGLAVTLYTFVLFIGATLGPIVAINLIKIGNSTVTFGTLASIVAVGLLASFFIKIESDSA